MSEHPYPNCTVACEAAVTCTTCGKRKAPRGRSVPMEAANSYCHMMDCTGYFDEPKAGHLWPGELANYIEVD